MEPADTCCIMTGLGLGWCREDAAQSIPGHQLCSGRQRNMLCILPGSELLHLKNDNIFKGVRSRKKERDWLRICESCFLSFARMPSVCFLMCLRCLGQAPVSVLRWSRRTSLSSLWAAASPASSRCLEQFEMYLCHCTYWDHLTASVLLSGTLTTPKLDPHPPKLGCLPCWGH